MIAKMIRAPIVIPIQNARSKVFPQRHVPDDGVVVGKAEVGVVTLVGIEEVKIWRFVEGESVILDDTGGFGNRVRREGV